MEAAQKVDPDSWVNCHVRPLIEESRAFWTSTRVRQALAIVGVMLVIEVLVAAAFFAGTDGQQPRGSSNAHRIIVSFFGLTSQWTKAIFVAEVHPEHTDPQFDIDLRDPFQVTGNLLFDLASMLRVWLLPLYAALAFTGASGGFATGDSPGRRFWRRSAAAVGPLALIALALTSAGVIIEQALPYRYAPVYEPSPYLAERLRIIPWGYVGESLLLNVAWLAGSFLLIPTIAAASRERQGALAACFGTTLFLVPLLTMTTLHFYPGGAYSAPLWLTRYDYPLMSLLLFVVVLPFALRRMRGETSCD